MDILPTKSTRLELNMKNHWFASALFALASAANAAPLPIELSFLQFNAD